MKVEIEPDHSLDRAVTALAFQDNSLAVGTEFKNQQAVVSLWYV